jgi:hypothetical protein
LPALGRVSSAANITELAMSAKAPATSHFFMGGKIPLLRIGTTIIDAAQDGNGASQFCEGGLRVCPHADAWRTLSRDRQGVGKRVSNKKKEDAEAPSRFFFERSTTSCEELRRRSAQGAPRELRVALREPQAAPPVRHRPGVRRLNCSRLRAGRRHYPLRQVVRRYRLLDSDQLNWLHSSHPAVRRQRQGWLTSLHLPECWSAPQGSHHPKAAPLHHLPGSRPSIHQLRHWVGQRYPHHPLRSCRQRKGWPSGPTGCHRICQRTNHRASRQETNRPASLPKHRPVYQRTNRPALRQTHHRTCQQTNHQASRQKNHPA